MNKATAGADQDLKCMNVTCCIVGLPGGSQLRNPLHLTNTDVCWVQETVLIHDPSTIDRASLVVTPG